MSKEILKYSLQHNIRNFSDSWTYNGKGLSFFQSFLLPASQVSDYHLNSKLLSHQFHGIGMKINRIEK